jgi:predicted anti-sigma-YlaC factor YlaD
VLGPSCAEIRRLLEPFVDRELGARERARVEAHLAACPACAHERRALEALVARLTAAGVAAPPEGLGDRLRRRLALVRPRRPRARWPVAAVPVASLLGGALVAAGLWGAVGAAPGGGRPHPAAVAAGRVALAPAAAGPTVPTVAEGVGGPVAVTLVAPDPAAVLDAARRGVARVGGALAASLPPAEGTGTGATTVQAWVPARTAPGLVRTLARYGEVLAEVGGGPAPADAPPGEAEVLVTVLPPPGPAAPAPPGSALLVRLPGFPWAAVAAGVVLVAAGTAVAAGVRRG